MKIFKCIILILLFPSMAYSQNARLDSVEIMMKENYLRYYIENISVLENSTKRAERLAYIKNCKLLYKLDTIQSNYFKEYDLLLLKNYGEYFECDGVKYQISSIKDGCEIYINNFLIGVSKERSLTNLLFLSGNFYDSDIYQFSPLKNDSNLINDSNFIKEVIRLKFEIIGSNYISSHVKISRKGNYEIYERKEKNDEDEKEYNKKKRIYFDLKKFIFIDSEEYLKLTIPKTE